ncbi:MAG TPA: hypothetical protein VF719_07215 [Abditibacteriaceae bacterium]|jgi:hypothetical protein
MNLRWCEYSSGFWALVDEKDMHRAGCSFVEGSSGKFPDHWMWTAFPSDFYTEFGYENRDCKQKTKQGAGTNLETEKKNALAAVLQLDRKELHESELREELESSHDSEVLSLLHDCACTLFNPDSSLDERAKLVTRIEAFFVGRFGPVHWVRRDCAQGKCETCNAQPWKVIISCGTVGQKNDELHPGATRDGSK